MTLNDSTKSGCLWLTVLIAIAGALLYLRIIPTPAIFQVESLSETATSLLEKWRFSKNNEVRIWTSTTGTTIEASFESATGTVVTLKKEDGQTLKVNRSDFSENDRLLLTRIHGPEEITISKEKPRIRVSVTMNGMQMRNVEAPFLKGTISLQNIANHAADDLLVYWTWAKQTPQKISLGSNAEKSKPKFRDARKFPISLGPLESISISTPEIDAKRKRNPADIDGLIVQVFSGDEMVSSGTTHSVFRSWSNDERLPEIAGNAQLIKNPEVTNAFGNARK